MHKLINYLNSLGTGHLN